VGVEFKSLEKGLCTLLLPIPEDHLSIGIRATVHGGVIFSLLDSAIGCCRFSVLEPHESHLRGVCKILNYTRAVIGAANWNASARSRTLRYPHRGVDGKYARKVFWSPGAGQLFARI